MSETQDDSSICVLQRAWRCHVARHTVLNSLSHHYSSRVRAMMARWTEEDQHHEAQLPAAAPQSHVIPARMATHIACMLLSSISPENVHEGAIQSALGTSLAFSPMSQDTKSARKGNSGTKEGTLLLEGIENDLSPEGNAGNIDISHLDDLKHVAKDPLLATVQKKANNSLKEDSQLDLAFQARNAKRHFLELSGGRPLTTLRPIMAVTEGHKTLLHLQEPKSTVSKAVRHGITSLAQSYSSSRTSSRPASSRSIITRRPRTKPSKTLDLNSSLSALAAAATTNSLSSSSMHTSMTNVSAGQGMRASRAKTVLGFIPGSSMGKGIRHEYTHRNKAEASRSDEPLSEAMSTGRLIESDNDGVDQDYVHYSRTGRRPSLTQNGQQEATPTKLAENEADAHPIKPNVKSWLAANGKVPMHRLLTVVQRSAALTKMGVFETLAVRDSAILELIQTGKTDAGRLLHACSAQATRVKRAAGQRRQNSKAGNLQASSHKSNKSSLTKKRAKSSKQAPNSKGLYGRWPETDPDKIAEGLAFNHAHFKTKSVELPVHWRGRNLEEPGTSSRTYSTMQNPVHLSESKSHPFHNMRPGKFSRHDFPRATSPTKSPSVHSYMRGKLPAGNAEVYHPISPSKSGKPASNGEENFENLQKMKSTGRFSSSRSPSSPYTPESMHGIGPSAQVWTKSGYLDYGAYVFGHKWKHLQSNSTHIAGTKTSLQSETVGRLVPMAEGAILHSAEPPQFNHTIQSGTAGMSTNTQGRETPKTEVLPRAAHGLGLKHDEKHANSANSSIARQVKTLLSNITGMDEMHTVASFYPSLDPSNEGFSLHRDNAVLDRPISTRKAPLLGNLPPGPHTLAGRADKEVTTFPTSSIGAKAENWDRNLVEQTQLGDAKNPQTPAFARVKAVERRHV